MLLHIPSVLTADEVAERRRLLDAAAWVDGRVTAGHQSVRTKDNQQLPEDHPVARQLGDRILGALQRNPLFISAALPLRVFPPLFNRYAGGQSFGNHVDNAIRHVTGTPAPHQDRSVGDAVPRRSDRSTTAANCWWRTPTACTRVKLPAGDMVLYPSTSLHSVQPGDARARVLRRSSGSRAWCATMAQRTLLFDLDSAIQQISRDVPEHPSSVQLTGVYHNLLRRWADA